MDKQDDKILVDKLPGYFSDPPPPLCALFPPSIVPLRRPMDGAADIKHGRRRRRNPPPAALFVRQHMRDESISIVHTHPPPIISFLVYHSNKVSSFAFESCDDHLH